MSVRGKFVPFLALAAMLALAAGPLPAQQTGTITGTVTDAASGRSLESAQVYIPTLEMGALSNSAGRFLLLNVPVGQHELSVELIGYGSASQTVTVSPGQTTNITFTLTSSALRLQELVVTGVAAETPRVKLPFTVEKVDMEDAMVMTSGADQMIQGKVAGAKVVMGDAQPGEQASIMFRGPTSLTGSQSPLVIVDGVITDVNLADIDALDVASVEIVKGAAAASMYGSRAANGVIQIATKRASGFQRDVSRVIVRNEYGQNSLESRIPLAQNHAFAMDAGQTSFVDEDGNPIPYGPGVVLDGANTSTTFQDNPFPGRHYDHIKKFFNPGNFYRNYVAVEGKSGNTSYRASFTNLHESGVVKENDGFTRNGFRVNVDHQVWDNLDVSLNSYYAQSRQEDIAGSPFFALTFMSPNIDLEQKDENGYYVFNADPLSLEENPLYAPQFISNWDKRSRFMASAFVRFRPTSWFELEGNYSLDRYDWDEKHVQPKGYQTVDNPEGGLGYLRNAATLENDQNASITASLNYAFGDLTTRTKLRYLLEDEHYENFSAGGGDLTVDDVPVLGVVSPDQRSISSSIQDVIAEGYFAITSLDYQGKYMLDGLVRRDGSSLFGADERWQTYYRGSVAWRLAQEDWWPFEPVNEFKLRYSYGTAGQRPGFSAQYETYSVSAGSITPVNLGNKALKPSHAVEQEMGADFVLFNQLAGGITYARSEVTDQFLSVPLPAFAGYSSQWQNAGALESNTWEFYLESAFVETEDYTWTARFNFDRTRQEITELDVPPYRFGSNDAFYMREGEVYGTFYGNRFAVSCSELSADATSPCSEFQVNDDGYLVWVGAGNTYQDGISGSLWGTESADGYDWGMPIKAVELDEDGDETNFLKMGNTLPDFTVSLANTFRWKGLSVYALLDWDQGADIYNGTAQWGYREWKHGAVDQAGKPDGLKKPVGYYSLLYNVNEISSAFVEDGSYIKLREVSLRYTLDQQMLDRLIGGRFGLSQATVNIIGRNLYTWTDFSGYDPEVGGGWGGSDAVGRIDSYQYPNYRTITASLELVF